MKTEIIKAELTYPLRHKVLLPHLPGVAYCYYGSDESPTSFHIGAFKAETLVSVGSFLLEFHPSFTETIQFRLRGMATLPEFRSQGLGEAVLRKGIEVFQARRGNLLWFNARIGAFKFYERNGFEFFGDYFELPHIGKHKVMFKKVLNGAAYSKIQT